MIYAVSDLHGCYDKYQKLLETLNLGENDTLFCAGGRDRPWAEWLPNYA